LDHPASPPVEIVEISRLFCSPTNPGRNDAAVPHVAASLRRFGSPRSWRCSARCSGEMGMRAKMRCWRCASWRSRGGS